MGLYVGNTRIAPVVRVNVTPNFKGVFNLITDLGLSIGATESQIATALATEIITAVQYDYCLVEIPDYQVYNGYSTFASVDDYVDYYVIYNDVYELVTNANKSSLGIVPKTTIAYILNNAYSVVRYNFDGTDWTSADNSGYANVDASNFTDSGTTFLSGLGMPDVTRVELLSSSTMSSGIEFTAPANGYFFAQANVASSANHFINIRYMDNLDYTIRYISWKNYSGSNISEIAPVHTGAKVSINWSGATASNVTILFIYAEGTPTPPQP